MTPGVLHFVAGVLHAGAQDVASRLEAGWPGRSRVGPGGAG